MLSFLFLLMIPACSKPIVERLIDFNSMSIPPGLFLGLLNRKYRVFYIYLLYSFLNLHTFIF